MRRYSIIFFIFLCILNPSVYAVDWWAVGMFVIQPFLNVFVQRVFAKDQKTERDRVNESLAVHLAVLNSAHASPELKKNAHDAIMREQHKARLLDIKEYVKDVYAARSSTHLTQEDKNLAQWGEQEMQESGKKMLQMSKNTS